MTLLGVALVLFPGGFYAAIGPSVGIVLPQGRPTIGWEASAISVAAGQVFAFGGPGTDAQPAWTRRTYVVWEPRFGEDTRRSNIMAGGGGTLGLRWDRDGDPQKPSPLFLGGVWGGAMVPSDPHTNYFSGHTLPYFSIALGWRGDEIYLTPKVGVLQEPNFPSD